MPNPGPHNETPILVSMSGVEGRWAGHQVVFGLKLFWGYADQRGILEPTPVYVPEIELGVNLHSQRTGATYFRSQNPTESRLSSVQFAGSRINHVAPAGADETQTISSIEASFGSLISAPSTLNEFGSTKTDDEVYFVPLIMPPAESEEHGLLTTTATEIGIDYLDISGNVTATSFRFDKEIHEAQGLPSHYFVSAPVRP